MIPLQWFWVLFVKFVGWHRFLLNLGKKITQNQPIAHGLPWLIDYELAQEKVTFWLDIQASKFVEQLLKLEFP